MRKRLIDAGLSFGVTFAVLVPAVRDQWPSQTAFDNDTVYATFATVAGALLGFTIAAAAIMLQTLSGRAFAKVRSKSDYLELYDDLKVTIAAFGANTIVSLGGVLLVEQGKNARDVWIFGSILVLTIFGGMSLMRSLKMLWTVVKAHANAESDMTGS